MIASKSELITFVKAHQRRVEKCLSNLYFQLDMIAGLSEEVLAYKVLSLRDSITGSLQEIGLMNNSLSYLFESPEDGGGLEKTKVSLSQLIQAAYDEVKPIYAQKSMTLRLSFDGLEQKRLSVIKSQVIKAITDLLYVGYVLFSENDQVEIKVQRQALHYAFHFNNQNLFDQHRDAVTSFIYVATTILESHGGTVVLYNTDDKTYATILLPLPRAS